MFFITVNDGEEHGDGCVDSKGTFSKLVLDGSETAVRIPQAENF